MKFFKQFLNNIKTLWPTFFFFFYVTGSVIVICGFRLNLFFFNPWRNFQKFSVICLWYEDGNTRTYRTLSIRYFFPTFAEVFKMLHALQILWTQEYMMRFPNKLSIDFNPLSKIFVSYLKLVAVSSILCCALILRTKTHQRKMRAFYILLW